MDTRHHIAMLMEISNQKKKVNNIYEKEYPLLHRLPKTVPETGFRCLPLL